MHPVRNAEDESLDLAWEAAVSAWVDGEAEMRAEELDSPYGRQVWDTYHLIGDVLRTPDLAIRPSDMFYARLSHAIDQEPVVATAPPRAQRWWRMSLSGMAMAASVAAIVWVAHPLILPTAEAPAEMLAAAAPQQLAVADVDEAVEEDGGLHDYLDAHQGMIGVLPIQQASYGTGAGYR